MSSGAERQAHLVIHPWVEGTVELWGHCVVCALSWFEVYVKGPYTAHSDGTSCVARELICCISQVAQAFLWAPIS